MKRNIKIQAILLLAVTFLFIFALSSCKRTENALLSEFKAMTQAEPTYRGLEKAVSFIDSNISSVSEEAGTRLILAYEDFLLRFLQNEETGEDQISGAELFIYTQYAQGKELKIVDYEAIINTYTNYISSELTELLSIKEMEAKQPSLKDATIMITYEDLLQRALRTENLLAAHQSEDALNASTLEYYKNYLFLLLAGSDKSPVFDYDTGVFSSEARDAFEIFIIEQSETIIAKTLTEYFSYLNNIKYTIDYMNATENKVFYDTCNYLINEAIKNF
ncbi:MAG: hypothetical protein EOM59_06955 [Clostridia bacterium]|nr:hypothetical protein [Clostridia bacterium]